MPFEAYLNDELRLTCKVPTETQSSKPNYFCSAALFIAFLFFLLTDATAMVSNSSADTEEIERDCCSMVVRAAVGFTVWHHSLGSFKLLGWRALVLWQGVKNSDMKWDFKSYHPWVFIEGLPVAMGLLSSRRIMVSVGHRSFWKFHLTSIHTVHHQRVFISLALDVFGAGAI